MQILGRWSSIVEPFLPMPAALSSRDFLGAGAGSSLESRHLALGLPWPWWEAGLPPQLCGLQPLRPPGDLYCKALMASPVPAVPEVGLGFCFTGVSSWHWNGLNPSTPAFACPELRT